MNVNCKYNFKSLIEYTHLGIGDKNSKLKS